MACSILEYSGPDRGPLMEHPTKCSRCGEEIPLTDPHFVIVNSQGVIVRLICSKEQCRKVPS
jgi:hypothetical protein